MGDKVWAGGSSWLLCMKKGERVLTFIKSSKMSYFRAPFDTSSDGGSSSYESDWEAEVNAR